MDESKGVITRLNLFTEKGRPGILVESCIFLKDLGMEGDLHAKGGERQITLLPGEIRDWMESRKIPGLCFKRYKANIETEGISVEELKPGTRLLAGTAILEVSAKIKECFPECNLYKQGNQCRLSTAGVFMKVVKSGEARKKDKIVIFA